MKKKKEEGWKGREVEVEIGKEKRRKLTKNQRENDEKLPTLSLSLSPLPPLSLPHSLPLPLPLLSPPHGLPPSLFKLPSSRQLLHSLHLLLPLLLLPLPLPLPLPPLPSPCQLHQDLLSRSLPTFPFSHHQTLALHLHHLLLPSPHHPLPFLPLLFPLPLPPLSPTNPLFTLPSWRHSHLSALRTP